MSVVDMQVYAAESNAAQNKATSGPPGSTRLGALVDGNATTCADLAADAAAPRQGAACASSCTADLPACFPVAGSCGG